MKKVLIVFGTRPEAIKMCPLVLELKKSKDIQTVVCLTGQHREMTRQVMDAFEIKEDYNLDIMKRVQTLSSVTTDILKDLESVLIDETPDLVLVHGDTTTSFASALASFYQKIPVGHVEAGLRTGNKYSPFPEEMNRCLTGKIATFHFAPTETNRRNLLEEGITDNVYVTGNTVIDSFATTVRDSYIFRDKKLATIDFSSQRVILVTAHRRENWGEPLKNICSSLKRIADEFADTLIVYPVHPNPCVYDTVHEQIRNVANIMLSEPLDVLDMHNLMARSYIVMTDSGGLQEEAPHFGKPVLVMRTETERPEAVESGTVRVVGVREEDIYKGARELLTDQATYLRMSKTINPYGDGQASQRIVRIIEEYLIRKNL